MLSDYDRGEFYRKYNDSWDLSDLSTTIQTGPHCCLALVQQTFLAHAIGLSVARLKQKSISVVYQCSTVTLEEVAKEGPGWLTLKDGALNLFDLSRKQLAKTSACARISGLSLAKLASVLRSSPSWVDADESLVVEIGKIEADSVAACARMANSAICARLLEQPQEEVITVDEHFVAELLVRHLRDETPMGRIFTDATAVAALHNGGNPHLTQKWSRCCIGACVEIG